MCATSSKWRHARMRREGERGKQQDRARHPSSVHSTPHQLLGGAHSLSAEVAGGNATCLVPLLAVRHPQLVEAEPSRGGMSSYVACNHLDRPCSGRGELDFDEIHSQQSFWPWLAPLCSRQYSTSRASGPGQLASSVSAPSYAPQPCLSAAHVS